MVTDDIKSILVDGQGYFYVEAEPKKYLGNPNFLGIVLDESDTWLDCIDFTGKVVKRVNLKYVIEINYE
jgi:hypothetical protein